MGACAQFASENLERGAGFAEALGDGEPACGLFAVVERGVEDAGGEGRVALVDELSWRVLDAEEGEAEVLTLALGEHVGEAQCEQARRAVGGGEDRSDAEGVLLAPERGGGGEQVALGRAAELDRRSVDRRGGVEAGRGIGDPVGAVERGHVGVEDCEGVGVAEEFEACRGRVEHGDRGDGRDGDRIGEAPDARGRVPEGAEAG